MQRMTFCLMTSALAVASPFLSACTLDQGSMSPASAPAITAFVSGAALEAVDARGRFVLRSPGRDTLSETQATALADAYLHTYGVMAVGRYRRETGVQFELAEARPCGPAYLTTSPYESVSGGSIQTQRYFGPHWLVTFCLAGNRPIVCVSVSALALELIGKDLRDPNVGIQPGDFREESIRPTMAGAPVSPELAVKTVAEMLDRRITTVPVLLQPPLPFISQLALWQVSLDRPVRVRGSRSGVDVNAQIVFFGWDLSAQSMRLHRSLEFEERSDSTIAVHAGVTRTVGVRNADLPGSFEPVTVMRAGAAP